MKKINVLLVTIIGLIFVGCSGSEAYRGNWKGMTPNGEKVEIVFEGKKITLSGGSKEIVTHDYSQYSVKIENSVETYGIKLDDGRGFKINFPIANDETVGLIKDENNNVLYAISRKEYINPNDIYKLK
jgi:hypothetical protein